MSHLAARTCSVPSWTCTWPRSPETVSRTDMFSRFFVCRQDASVLLKASRRTNTQRGSEDINRALLGLNGWYTGLETRRFQVSRDRLRLTLYAAFLTRRSDSSSSRPGLSISDSPSRYVPSAGWGSSSSAGTVTSGRPWSARVHRKPHRGSKPREQASVSVKSGPCSGSPLGMFFLTASGFLPEGGGASRRVQVLRKSSDSSKLRRSTIND